jgi:hypothetical protein
LVTNPEFAIDLLGWKNSGAGSWSSDDAGGLAGSGSAKITIGPVLELHTLTSTCMPASAGSDYEFSVASKYKGLLGASGFADACVFWYAQSDCRSYVDEVRMLASSSTWTTTTASVTAPAGTRSAVVLLRAYYNVTANFDDVRFAELGSVATTTLPLTTTTVVSPCDGNCGHRPGSAGPEDPVTATDALFILRAAVGQLSCEPCVCNANGTGGITASDALLVLRAAVGAPVDLSCPS